MADDNTQLDKTWHLASSDEEIKITDVELLLWRVTYAFFRWQEECEKVSSGINLSADDLAVLHVIRMKDRPKSVADIGRILNRDNFFSINYNIKKLMKIGLITKLGDRKQYQYMVTDSGKKNTDEYTSVRRSILINEFKKDLEKINLEEIKAGLIELKKIYDEAVRVTSSFQPTSVSDQDQPPKKKSNK